MSIKSDNDLDLDRAVRKIERVRTAVANVASESIMRMLTDAIRLIETHACPEPPPEPAYVFRVGHVLRLTAEVDALPFGTVVRTNTHRTAEKRPETWVATTSREGRGYAVDGTELFGAKIIYLPEEN